jgi:peptidoglycan/LPS O-acetylase OafA/YrhL
MAVSRPGHEIPSLDGLRAISFLIVFVSHAGLPSLIPGGFGVTVFFFLSGFLITTLLRLEQQESGHIVLRDFYARRALRILPPFYTVLILAVAGAAIGWIPGTLAPAPIAALAFHYSNYWTIAHGDRGMPAGTVVYWSLAVEEHFYLLFPWIFRVLYRRLATGPARGRALLLLCGLIMAWRFALVLAFHSPENRTYMASDTRFDSILFGCALALGLNPVLDPMPFRDRTWKWVWLPLGLGGLLFSFLDRDPAFRETWRYTLQGVALVPVFVTAMRYPRWGPMRVLNWRPLRFIGVLSYSLYLLHLVVIGVVDMKWHLHGFVAGALSLAISIAVAWAIHLAIERPATRLRRRLSHAVVREPARAT